MKTLIPKSSGNIEYWLATYPGAAQISTVVLVNRSGASVLAVGSKNKVIGRDSFKQGTPVAIVLPKGNWKVERSEDGRKFTEVTTLTAWTEDGTHANLTLDGKTPFAKLWGRYTRM